MDIVYTDWLTAETKVALSTTSKEKEFKLTKPSNIIVPQYVSFVHISYDPSRISPVLACNENHTLTIRSTG